MVTRVDCWRLHVHVVVMVIMLYSCLQSILCKWRLLYSTQYVFL